MINYTFFNILDLYDQINHEYLFNMLHFVLSILRNDHHYKVSGLIALISPTNNTDTIGWFLYSLMFFILLSADHNATWKYDLKPFVFIWQLITFTLAYIYPYIHKTQVVFYKCEQTFTFSIEKYFLILVN